MNPIVLSAKSYQKWIAVLASSENFLRMNT